MVIQVSIDTTEPLTGSATRDEHEPVPFVGWLQMLRAVADLVGSSECAAERPADADQLPTAPLPVGEHVGTHVGSHVGQLMGQHRGERLPS
jgi:hypothetical protein